MFWVINLAHLFGRDWEWVIVHLEPMLMQGGGIRISFVKGDLLSVAPPAVLACLFISWLGCMTWGVVCTYTRI